ncbi:D-glucuronyl C5-epimerase-like [Paramacrobiotus metropolitanus]|uniref:D-glucuronyl C5-epimerase-like n=1 Tax=Paramacrobiotus metropolitanus TaxID=2943436 RepID=UPI002445BC29|nr:D-glucuronyl C5-epimerase-like [Paramacrobiotus metropolitanus]
MRFLIRMRFILPFLVGAFVAFLASIAYWRSNCQPITTKLKPRGAYTHAASSANASWQKIPCIINGNRRNPVDCRVEPSNEVFLPFSFIARYFEITGKIETDKKSLNAEKFFNWQHSYAKLILPKLPYESDGIFMSFDNYNVEVRDRVKCISAIEGVPVSSQWSTSGHVYPVQVAQFGLSHYSKNISEERPRHRLVANFERDFDFDVPRGSYAERIEDSEKELWVLNFSAPVNYTSPGIPIPFPDTGEPYVIFGVKFYRHGAISFHLEVQETERTTYELIYACGADTISTQGNRVIYGLGSCSEWNYLVRDVYVDLIKGLNLYYKKSSKKDKIRFNMARMRIQQAELHGRGLLDGLTLASSAHSELFEKAADWLVRSQDTVGGWPVTVKRKLGSVELEPPWYSAMAQGQAMSTLIRAYKRLKNHKYLQAAVKALDLFSKSSEAGGISAVFMNKFVWFEEYPTNPPSFVLNGFIYALLGLYDVKTVADGNDAERSGKLFDTGVESLKALLPLYDTGSGSVYDLRHFTLKGPPNLARWDYHSTHITQLQVMNSIHPDPVFADFAERWAQYMKGQRADHN